MDSYLFVIEIENLLRKIGSMMNKKLRESLHKYDLTPPQFHALIHTYKNKGVTIGELCDHMFLACSTVSGLVDRIEEKGWIRRIRDKQDRRIVRLELTESGEQLVEEILERRRATLVDNLKSISQKEQKELARYLKLLSEIMEPAKD
ncbi:MAG: MarR family transcriptional regulator [Halanaerobium sp.]|nr:MarR family transcriptional regulator [Halanaerobium sp.]